MIDLDNIDINILRELRGNARLSNVDLASRVNLSPSACLRRVQDLERKGVIAGYHAKISKKARNVGFVAYVTVGLSNHQKKTQETFEQSVAYMPQVVECHNTTGNFEYLLRVEVSDLESYKEFHTEKLGSLPDVATITSYVVMGSPKDERN